MSAKQHRHSKRCCFAAQATSFGAEEIAQERRSGKAWAAHRLDRDTSGVLLLAKTLTGLENLWAQFREKSRGSGALRKRYIAIVEGELEESRGVRLFMESSGDGKMAVSLDPRRGKLARTTVESLLTFETTGRKQRSLLGVDLHTGRKHQIRASLDAIGLPVAYDPLYGEKDRQNRLRLHAQSITFARPGSSNLIEVRAPLPDDFFRDVTSSTRQRIETAVSDQA